jgi:hypothetical protein
MTEQESNDKARIVFESLFDIPAGVEFRDVFTYQAMYMVWMISHSLYHRDEVTQ